MNSQGYIDGFSKRLKEALSLVPGSNVDSKAKILGTTNTTLYSYLNAKTLPPVLFLKKLKEFSNISIDWLMTGETQNKTTVASCAIDYKRFDLIADRLILNVKKSGMQGVSVSIGLRDSIVIKIYNSLINFDTSNDKDGSILIAEIDKLLDFSLTYAHYVADYEDRIDDPYSVSLELK